MSGEFPVLAAGSLALAGGYAREGKFPSDGVKAVVGTLGLVVVVSALSRTKFAPVSNGLAWLVLLGAAYASIPVLQSSHVKAIPGKVAAVPGKFPKKISVTPTKGIKK